MLHSLFPINYALSHVFAYFMNSPPLSHCAMLCSIGLPYGSVLNYYLLLIVCYLNTTLPTPHLIVQCCAQQDYLMEVYSTIISRSLSAILAPPFLLPISLCNAVLNRTILWKCTQLLSLAHCLLS